RGRAVLESSASQRGVVSICGFEVSREGQPVRSGRVAGRFGLVRRAGMASDAAIRQQPTRARAEADYRKGLQTDRNRSQSDLRKAGVRRTQQEQGYRVRLRGRHLLRLPARDFAWPG